ncbi:MAG: serine hydrolase domain-containing protein [Lachnospiraceae bacterium]
MALSGRKDLTVRHLLTMTSGVSFNETGAISGNDWVKGYLEAFCHHEPGTYFEYNSMNTYMLSAIITEITGETMLDYLKPRLFAPLGITRVFWETCPKGKNKGGWGLFLCCGGYGEARPALSGRRKMERAAGDS